MAITSTTPRCWGAELIAFYHSTKTCDIERQQPRMICGQQAVDDVALISHQRRSVWPGCMMPDAEHGQSGRWYHANSGGISRLTVTMANVAVVGSAAVVNCGIR